jgi:transcription initiation factor TFIIF subunit alpha
VRPPPAAAPPTQDTQSASALPTSAAASSTSTPAPAQPSRPAFLSRPRSPTPEGEPQIIPVYTTKRELLEGLRFHYAKLQSTRGENINILDESKFTRPIRLHRREPRPIFADDAMDVDEKEDVVDDKEKERLEAAKLDRQRQREENAKQIAPTASSKRKLPAFKKKTEQVFRTDDTPEERKRNLLRYEETLPWHLEDDDNKNVWVGTYEEALSEKYILFLPEEGRFRMVPVEKFYRFRQKGKAKQVDYDTAEKMMSAKSKEPRWIMKHKEKQQKEKDLEAQSNKARGLYTRLGDRLEDAENAKEFGEVAPNVDEMDFNVEEEFADDEENPIFEGDDDTLKEAEDKMRKDQLEANTFGVGDETKVDEEEEAKMLAYAVKRAQGKDILKALRKREKRYDQEDISDEMDSDEVCLDAMSTCKRC